LERSIARTRAVAQLAACCDGLLIDERTVERS
jgi:hypothetical protein